MSYGKERNGLRQPRPTGIRGLTVALVCYSVFFAIQLVAYFITHFGVLYSQALETLSDVMLAGALLLVTFFSFKPADEGHLFGHERAQNVAAVIAATVLIVVFSFESIRKGIEGFLAGPKHLHHGGLALLVTAMGMVIVAIPIVVITREKTSAASARAELVGLARDEFAYVIALVTITLTIKNEWWADPVGSIVIGITIALAAFYLFRQNITFLIGKAPGKETMDEIQQAVLSVPGVTGMHKLMAEYIGPDHLHVDLHITVDPAMSVEDANRIAREVLGKLATITGHRESGIHIDPDK